MGGPRCHAAAHWGREGGLLHPGRGPLRHGRQEQAGEWAGPQRRPGARGEKACPGPGLPVRARRAAGAGALPPPTLPGFAHCAWRQEARLLTVSIEALKQKMEGGNGLTSTEVSGREARDTVQEKCEMRQLFIQKPSS